MSGNAEQLPHLLILDHVESREFKRGGGGPARIRDVDRRKHGRRMLSEVSNALAEQDGKRHLVDLDQLKATGVIIAIEGPVPTNEVPASSRSLLKLESLDQMSRHRDMPRPKWILLNVTSATDRTPERAQVWISDEYRAGFLKLFERFLHEDHGRSGKPKNRALVANMNRVRSAVLRDLWQSEGDPPTSGLYWWEIWMRPEPDAIPLAATFTRRFELRLAERHLRLNNRHIIWLQCRWKDLQALMVSAVPVAEIRRPQFVDTIEDLDPREQGDYVRHLAERLVLASELAPAVCLLDTGVRRTHELLEGSLAAHDMHTVVGEPSTDRHGHGTRMAGLALLGPLDPPLLDSNTVRLRHRLESVKYLPDSSSQTRDPESYGVATAEAVAMPEIASDRRRTYNLAITAESERPGEPSLWSAAIDALAVGTDIGRSPQGIDLLGVPQRSVRRLIIVSAGNVKLPYKLNYLDKCDMSPIEDPAQAWNALTVGAYTELDALPSDPSFEGWAPVATPGDISPHSRTGLIAGGARWPSKPDICMEGGNVCMEGGNVITDKHGDFVGDHSLLSLRATSNRDDTALEAANATSAAAAQASRLAARAMATYPDYWPETIRGLMTHSADWTPVMRERVLARTGKTSRAQMVRRYGWGVPDDGSVQTSARNAVTMVVQDEFTPFTGRDYSVRHFRLHQLPWPTSVLDQLGEKEIKLRVTLSYFVEPSASRRGWRGRYAYASHGFRFELRAPNETTPDFVRRVNREAVVEEDGQRSLINPLQEWLIGPRARNTGSLHQDIWEGYGAQLATTGVLAVYPVGGWWKYNRRKDRMDLPLRYALLVSLRTRAEGVDLYTPIATSIRAPVTAAEIEI